jgi:hypothetical protein
MTGPKDANEAIDEITEDVTIDTVMRRDPRELKDDDYVRFIEAQRTKRAMFIKDSAARKEKRRGFENPDKEE